ncbi:MAG: GNAT family N-acetyltransferase [Halanaerobiales bacterium]
MIRRIEEITINAWPSLQTYVYDGWLIRFADGYTKRANSINPLYESSEKLERKIDYCESIFQDRDLPVVFKLTDESKPVELDEVLEKRGYSKVDITSLQILDLTDKDIILLDQAEICIIERELSDRWLITFSKFSNLSNKEKDTMNQMLNKSTVENFYFTLVVDREIIACGLAVQEGRYFGLFDIIVSEEYRGRGYGEELIKSMLNFARNNSAQIAYLQVVQSNFPAINLYSKLGFKEVYQYWYRGLYS